MTSWKLRFESEFTRRLAQVSFSIALSLMGSERGFSAVGQMFPGYQGLPPSGQFVKIEGQRFTRNQKPYNFMGANYWQGMNLGAPGELGNRAQLIKDLDQMAALGVRNLRILAASEGLDSDPWQIVPALQPEAGVFRESLLEGLDFLLVEMAKRNMTAVVVLNNFWPWSGGMAQYLKWATGQPIPYPPPQPGGDWYKYETFTAQFYSVPKAVAIANESMRRVIQRVNSLTGLPYAQDPTIFSWELANEPRGTKNEQAFGRWIQATSSLIKSWDSVHLVTTGTEGFSNLKDMAGGINVYPSVDYLTLHVWVQNAGWYNPKMPQVTFDLSLNKMRGLVRDRLQEANLVQKPLVLEEFGLARDLEKYQPATPVTYRDRYYQEVFSQVQTSSSKGGHLQGVNFWAWSGDSVPVTPGGHWKVGHPLIGDPPHEPQGWYSVYSSDYSTLKIIQNFATGINSPQP